MLFRSLVGLLATSAAPVEAAGARQYAATVVVSDLHVPQYTLQVEGPLTGGWTWSARAGVGTYSVGKDISLAQTLLREVGARLAWYPAGDASTGWRLGLDGRWADNRTRGEHRRFDGSRVRLGAMAGLKWTGRWGLVDRKSTRLNSSH